MLAYSRDRFADAPINWLLRILFLLSACDTGRKEKNWQNTHYPSTVNVMSIMLMMPATHGVPHSPPVLCKGTLTAHCLYMQTSSPRHVVC
jgi:hypothetical protein